MVFMDKLLMAITARTMPYFTHLFLISEHATTGTVSCKPVINTISEKSQGLNGNLRTLAILSTLNRPETDFFHCLWAEFSSILSFYAKE
jgi:hypothetical protein